MGRDNEKGDAFIFEDFNTMEGGGAFIYLRLENLKFGVRLFLKICTLLKQGGGAFIKGGGVYFYMHGSV